MGKIGILPSKTSLSNSKKETKQLAREAKFHNLQKEWREVAENRWAFWPVENFEGW